MGTERQTRTSKPKLPTPPPLPLARGVQGASFAGRGAARTGVLITCEHAGREVPTAAYAALRGLIPASVLRVHRGYDPGALELAVLLQAVLRRGQVAVDSRLHVNAVTRLVVDLNRSPTNPAVFSRWTSALDERTRARLLTGLHVPFRAACLRDAHRVLRANGRRLLHVSVHSFTPVLRGERRKVDVGFLFDPSRGFERRVVDAWMDRLAAYEPRLRLRRNQPYKGTDDGHTTHLRTVFGDERYAGIEIEVNQRFVRAGASTRRWTRLQQAIARSLVEAIDVVNREAGVGESRTKASTGRETGATNGHGRTSARGQRGAP